MSLQKFAEGFGTGTWLFEDMTSDEESQLKLSLLFGCQ